MDEFLKNFGRLVGAARFRRISEKLYTEGDSIYKEAGIDFKTTWFPVFYTLACSEQKLTINDISEQIGFTNITVKNVLKELKEKELACIIVNPNDGRSKLAGLSEKGKTLLNELVPIWKDYSEVLDDIYNNMHEELIEILDRIEYELEKKPIIERMKIHSKKN